MVSPEKTIAALKALKRHDIPRAQPPKDDPLQEIQLKEGLRLQRKAQGVLEKIIPGKVRCRVSLELEPSAQPTAVVPSAPRRQDWHPYDDPWNSNHLTIRPRPRINTGFRVKQISVYILSDGLTAEEQAAVSGFVHAAIGLDEARGDTRRLYNQPWTEQERAALRLSPADT